MFQVKDALGYVHTAYGTFVDDEGDIQFILADSDGVFYKTNMINGYYKLYERFVIEVPNEEDRGNNMSMSMESNEMCEYYESVILDMLKEYETKKEKYAEDVGAINALKELLKRLEE